MRISTGRLISNFFILGLVILIFTDLLYPSKGFNVNRLIPQVGRAIMLILMIFSIIWLTLIHGKIKKNEILTACIIFTIYSLFSFLLRFEYINENFMVFVKTIYWVIGFILAYMLSSFGYLTNKHMEYLAISSIILFLLIILRDYSNNSLFRPNKDFFVSNNGYNLLRFFPYIFIIRRNSLKIALYAIIGIGVVLSLKRGTMLAYTVSSLLLFYILFFGKKQSIRINKFILLFAFLAIASVLIYFIKDNIDTIQNRLSDFKSIETAGSGRGNMYQIIIQKMIFDSSILRVVFGYGFLATMQFLDYSIGQKIVAHSDMLELFFDYGIIGLLIFGYLVISIFKLSKILKKRNFHEWVSIIIWLLVFTMSSIYSVNLFSPEMIYSIVLIAFIQGKIYIKST